MTYSYDSLRGKIVEVYGSQRKFADALGISQTALSRKMTCKTGLSQNDIEKWAKMLNIQTVDDFGKYFFS